MGGLIRRTHGFWFEVFYSLLLPFCAQVTPRQIYDFLQNRKHLLLQAGSIKYVIPRVRCLAIAICCLCRTCSKTRQPVMSLSCLPSYHVNGCCPSNFLLLLLLLHLLSRQKWAIGATTGCGGVLPVTRALSLPIL